MMRLEQESLAHEMGSFCAGGPVLPFLATFWGAIACAAYDLHQILGELQVWSNWTSVLNLK